MHCFITFRYIANTAFSLYLILMKCIYVYNVNLNLTWVSNITAVSQTQYSILLFSCSTILCEGQLHVLYKCLCLNANIFRTYTQNTMSLTSNRPSLQIYYFTTNNLSI